MSSVFVWSTSKYVFRMTQFQSIYFHHIFAEGKKKVGKFTRMMNGNLFILPPFFIQIFMLRYDNIATFVVYLRHHECYVQSSL